MTRKTTAYGRKLARQNAWQRNRHQTVNPVTESVIKAKIDADISRLRTACGLQIFAGESAAKTCDLAGRVIYITCHAAKQHGLEHTPEARIMAGAANALGELAESPAQLDRQRGAISSGLDAAERLLPKLNTWSLAAGALELDQLLNSTRGMGTSDVRAALGWDGAKTA